MVRISISDLETHEPLCQGAMSSLFGGKKKSEPMAEISSESGFLGMNSLSLPDAGDLRNLADEVWMYVEERLGEILDEGSLD
jgi:hypothetical protein